ncbi:hypothetical protein [Streptomyces sp. NPDC090445]|uniref:hypothetical protein n=1 Tax=Streptomyces sp. NPDC090445 TaxID=3365963 RepID=UPI0037F149F6
MQGLPGPQGLAGATGPCSDIDSYSPSNSEDFHAALIGGRVYGGRASAPGGIPTWQDFSVISGYPTGVPCGVSITAQGPNAYIKVLTVARRIYQLRVSVNGQNFSPDLVQGWIELTPGPTPATLRE